MTYSVLFIFDFSFQFLLLFFLNVYLQDWSDKDNNEDLAQLHNNDENFSDFSSEDDEFQSQGPFEKLK